MTIRAPTNAEVLRRRTIDSTEVRALKTLRRGRVTLLLEINASRLRALLAADDDRPLYRCTEFDTEAELLTAFERVSMAVAS
jgi:hypothetical protein